MTQGGALDLGGPEHQEGERPVEERMVSPANSGSLAFQRYFDEPEILGCPKPGSSCWVLTSGKAYHGFSNTEPY